MTDNLSESERELVRYRELTAYLETEIVITIKLRTLKKNRKLLLKSQKKRSSRSCKKGFLGISQNAFSSINTLLLKKSLFFCKLFSIQEAHMTIREFIQLSILKPNKIWTILQNPLKKIKGIFFLLVLLLSIPGFIRAGKDIASMNTNLGIVAKQFPDLSIQDGKLSAGDNTGFVTVLMFSILYLTQAESRQIMT